MTPAEDTRVTELLRANKLELIEKLADDLAHEIKNPLHAMSLHLEILRRRMAAAVNREGGEADEVERYFSRLTGDVERVSRNVDLLLTLTRVAGANQRASLNELMSGSLELLRIEAQRRSVDLRFQPGQSLEMPAGEPEVARLAVLNFMVGVLELSPDSSTTELSTRASDGLARLEVTLSTPGARIEANPRIEAAAALARGLGGRLHTAEGGSRLTLELPATGNERPRPVSE